MIEIAPLGPGDVGRWVVNPYLGYDGLKGRVVSWSASHVMVRYAEGGGSGPVRVLPSPTLPNCLEWAEAQEVQSDDKCPECDGYGTYVVRNLHTHSDSEYPCEHCGGTGRVARAPQAAAP